MHQIDCHVLGECGLVGSLSNDVKFACKKL